MTVLAAFRIGQVALLALVLAGCAASFAPRRLATPAELRGTQSMTLSDVTVTVAVLTDDQAMQHFGVDFAKRELQALWMSVRNGSDRRLWFIRNVLDPDFYSAEEAALLVEADVPTDARDRLHPYFRDESVRVHLAPMTVTEGFVYLPRVEGGRYVDVRLLGDVYLEEAAKHSAGAGVDAAPNSNPRELRFVFALPLPDGDFDYERIDPTQTYAGRLLPDLTVSELRATLDRAVQPHASRASTVSTHRKLISA